MKYLFSLLGLCLLSLNVDAQNLTFHPEHPVPGEKLTIKYVPAGTPLENATELETTAYLLEGELPKAIEVKLEFDGKRYKGTIESTKETKALFITLKDASDEKSDNNEGAGYRLKFYKEDQSGPRLGAYFALAQAYGSYFRIMDIERDQEKAMKYLKKEFAKNPEAKTEAEKLALYATFARQQKDEEAESEITAYIQSIMQKRKATEKELTDVYYLYRNLRQNEEAEALAEKIKKKYKKGDLVKQSQINAFYNAKDLETQLEIFEKFHAKYGEEEEHKNTIGSMASRIGNSYGKKSDWANFDKYMAMVKNPQSKAGAYNNLAWAMAGEGLTGEVREIEKAKELSKKSLKLLKEEMKTAANKPVYYTAKRWKKQLEGAYSMYADTYALTAYHTEDYETALKYQQMVCEEDNFENGEMNERYAVYFEKVKGAEESLTVLDGLIRKGKATTAMKEQHKRLFMDNYTLADAYGKYMLELEADAEAAHRKKLKEKMINDPAPEFSLVDLNGKEVSLKSLKGKVVVLDFWATWCGPCKASFPGMQKALNQYASNSEVAFLFVNSWESGKEKKKAAGDFIQKNNYTFQVLMDEKDEVIAKYGVEGIPTKFIIDKNGQIRFKSVGYSGNNEELIKELSMMIEMAGNSGRGVTGAE